MKKTITAVIVSAALLVPNMRCAEATENIYLNDEALDSLRSEDGRDKIAVRSFFEAAGYTVLWQNSKNCVVIFNSDRRITMYADDNIIFLDQTGYFLDDDISYIDGSLAMPVDAAELALDAVIEYRGNNLYITTDAAEDSSNWMYEVFSLTNAEREKRGLRKLIWNPDLARAAENHCADMAARGYFSHNTPEGIDPFARLAALGIRFTHAAENLAAGQPDPESVVEAWMNSADHRDNILNPDLTEMGCAFSRGGSYGIYWAQEFATTE